MPSKRQVRKGGKKRDKYPPAGTFTLTDLEQLKVLADPLRVRILEALCEERTTKQVAQSLGEKPTKLYHHVDALARVGVIRQTRTRRNRGTLEKYYQAVARAFRADASLFPQSMEADADHPSKQIIFTLMEKTSAELRQMLAQPSGPGELEEEGVVGLVEVRAGRKQIVKIRRRIEKLLQGFQAIPDSDGDKEERRFRLTVAFYPLDKIK